MDSMLRVLDAAQNRAREGLRVLEDIARFVLDDRDLTERLKRARHGLRGHLEHLPVSGLSVLASRDTPGDVGTGVRTAAELDRGAGVRDLASAAAKRAQEALRSLEECAKAYGSTGAGFAATRYELYDIERVVLLRLAPACPQWTLCVLVTSSVCVHHAPEDIIRHAARGGADCVQIREKRMDDGPLLEHAARMVGVCRSVGVHAMINDRADIARLAGADGVHLGQSDLPVRAARAILGAGRWIGVTCASVDASRRAAEEHADTLGLGPVFPSRTKAKPDLAGTGLIAAVNADPVACVLPSLAISGITPENAAAVGAAGGKGVAVCSSVCAAEDPAAVCRSIVRALAVHGHATIAP